MKTNTCSKLLVLILGLAGSSLVAQEQAPPVPQNGAAAATPITSEVRKQALADAAAGQWDKAQGVLVALSEKDPVDVDACVALSRACMHNNDTKKAVSLLERASSASPDRAELQVELGNVLARRIGEVNFLQQAMIASKMRGAYEKAVALDPKNINGWIGLAQYFSNAPAVAGGSLEKATEYAKQVEKLDPYQGALQLGFVAAKGGNLERASEDYKRAGEMKPTEPWPYVFLGQAYLNAKKLPEAKQAFEIALQRRPNCAPAAAGLRGAEDALGKSKS